MIRLLRFLKFNAVGTLNLAVKLGLLAVLRELARLDYLVATTLAVEATILHGFFWHHFWTWRDRHEGVTPRVTLQRLVHYNLVTGTLAVAVNLVVMRFLVGVLGLHYLPAAVAATPTAGLIGFFLSDTWIFTRRDARSG